MPDGVGWRSEAATAYLVDAQPTAFAWEFLRRDPDYRQDYQRMSLHLEGGTSTESEVALALAKRWGLKFPV